VEGADQAYVLELAGPVDRGKLARLKRELRLIFPGQEARFEGRVLRVSTVHTADPGKEQGEWEMIRGWAQDAP